MKTLEAAKSGLKGPQSRPRFSISEISACFTTFTCNKCKKQSLWGKGIDIMPCSPGTASQQIAFSTYSKLPCTQPDGTSVPGEPASPISQRLPHKVESLESLYFTPIPARGQAPLESSLDSLGDAFPDSGRKTRSARRRTTQIINITMTKVRLLGIEGNPPVAIQESSASVGNAQDDQQTCEIDGKTKVLLI